MILYLDTSSLVKIYVEEKGSGVVRKLVAAASLVATSVIAYPEVRSALARLRREGKLSEADYKRSRRDFDQAWTDLLDLPVEDSVWRQAGDLAERHGLRGFDSLHLASYCFMLSRLQGMRVEFSSFDERLNQAAAIEAGSA